MLPLDHGRGGVLLTPHQRAVYAVLDDWEDWLSTSDIAQILEIEHYFEKNRLYHCQKSQYVYKWVSRLARCGLVEKRCADPKGGRGRDSYWRVVPE